MAGFRYGVVGLAAPLPLVGGLRGTPRLKSSEPKVTGVDGGGIMRVAALAVWLRGVATDLLRSLGPLPALVKPGFGTFMYYWWLYSKISSKTA